MSQITLIYAALESFVTSNLPTYKRAPNGYAVESASQLILARGWGLEIGAGTNAKRYVGCKHATAREVTVHLINQAAASDHDAAGHKTAELAILEDSYKLRKAIESDNDLGGTAANAEWTGDTGIEWLEGDRFRYYKVSLTFTIEYHESN